MISVNNLSKVFVTEEIETTALDGVSFEIGDGEFVAVMGPSGCGKSTLLNILGLLDSPTSGSYLLSGAEMSGLKESERTRLRKGNIGFVFQSFNLIDELNVYENVELPLRYLDIPASERKERVYAMLKRMNISARKVAKEEDLAGVRILILGRNSLPQLRFRMGFLQRSHPTAQFSFPCLQLHCLPHYLRHCQVPDAHFPISKHRWPSSRWGHLSGTPDKSHRHRRSSG